VLKKIDLLEALVVIVALGVIAYLGGSKFTDWTAAAAVFIGFLYAQLSFNIAEEKTATASEALEQARLKQVFVVKELLWIVTFAALGSYPLLVGAFLFMVYPATRTLVRGGSIPAHSREGQKLAHQSF